MNTGRARKRLFKFTSLVADPEYVAPKPKRVPTYYYHLQQ